MTAPRARLVAAFRNADVREAVRTPTPAEIADALRCRAVSRDGRRCVLNAPHLGTRHLGDTDEPKAKP